jgi:hypothetical protein
MQLESSIRRRRAVMYGCVILTLLLVLFVPIKWLQGISVLVVMVAFFALLKVFPAERLHAPRGLSDMLLGRWASTAPRTTERLSPYRRFAKWAEYRIDNQKFGYRWLIRLFGELPPGP